MKKLYKDLYGCTASITEVKDGHRLKICTPYGACHTDKVYKTERGTRNVMGRFSDCWKEVGKK
ncbi:hypothetical protein KQI61_15550 [Anaerocolumna aminovalerica]|uniref:hypothetical protein n=1 Tax=Anaerocolumna aminovalerica TaxID=1527 RepID=UPI001C0EE84C|nr:hypothetical protein [Anaerocolumna aminovalerica]MBU5333614.1 hypothetical protein [Anaerocolumna aminovalerica]